MKFIVEHLEPELFEWCLIEYKHISKIVGKNDLIFTNVKKGKNKLIKYGKVYSESVSKLNLRNACILDPSAGKTLSKKDNFDYIILGGILGDYPPKKRTKKELSSKLKFPARNLGRHQFSTDNAAYVALQLLKGKKLSDLKFQSGIEVRLNKVESVELPFRYVIVSNKPLMSKELVRHLKERKEF